MPIISIIIVSYNTRDLLKKCLQSIYENKPPSPLEVIVIDNNSIDNTREIIKEKFPKVIFIQNKTNVGFGRANNQGAEIANGEYLLFLNSDTIILDNAIEKILKFAQDHPNNVLGGKLLNPDLSPQTSCGPFFSLPVIFAMLFLQGDQLGLTRYSPKTVKEVGWLSGACLFIRNETFKGINGFDNNIFMYLEEVELLYRLRKTGVKVFFIPQAKFVHIGGASSKGNNESVVNIYKGLSYFYLKHQSVWKQQVVIGMLKIKALIAILIGNLSRNTRLVNTYQKAYATITRMV